MRPPPSLGGTLLPVLVALAAPGAVGAQTYRVPESPAFTWLSASPAHVTHPTTARGLASSLATLIDSTGTVRQGFALDAAPWVWIPGVRIPADQYGDPLKYALANTVLSFGTAAAGGGSGDTDVALGLRTTFFDQADPMRDPAFRDTLRAVQAACGADPDLDPDDVLACAGEGAEKARNKWLAGRWNAGSLSAAFVTGWRFADSRPSAGAWGGWSAWASGALPVGSWAQLLGQVQYAARRALPADSVRAGALDAGARLVVGSSWVNGFAETSVARRLGGRAEDRTTAQWSAGVEFRAASSLWLSTGLGSGFATDASDRMVVLANVRWRVSDVPRLAPR